MTHDDLKRLVSFGEGPQIEFKHRVPQPVRIAREVIALANTRGGKLLLGVADDGEILGLKDPEEEVFALRAALDHYCEPPVTLRVEGVRVSRRREVLVVDVPESAQKPHFLVEAPSGDGAGTAADVARTAFVRVGEHSIEASREAVRLMRAERNPTDTRFTFGDTEQLLLRYLERHERVTVKQYARLAGIKERDASHTLVLLTRARVLRHHPEPGEDYFTAA